MNTQVAYAAGAPRLSHCGAPKVMKRPLLFACAAIGLAACSSTPEPEAESTDDAVAVFLSPPPQQNRLAQASEGDAPDLESLLRVRAAPESSPRRESDRRPIAEGRLTTMTLLIEPGLDPRLAERFAAVTPDYPVAVTERRDTLPRTSADCDPANLDGDCLAELRDILNSHALLAIGRERGGDGRLWIRHYDLRLGAAYPAWHRALPANNRGIPDTTFDQLAEAALLAVMDRSRVLPWSAMLVAEDDGEWTLQAGAADGVAPGAELYVIRGSDVLPSLNGEPSAWIPGEPVARLIVERLDDDGKAVAVLDEGQPPRETDLILPVR